MQHRRERATLLIVEDDPAQAFLISKKLRTLDAQTVHARSMADANDALASASYDLVVLDLTLPDGNGFELQDKLRDQGNAPPLLFLTADEEPESAVRALESGAAGYLVKRPGYTDVLSAKVARLLQRGAGAERNTGGTAGATSAKLLGSSAVMKRVRNRIAQCAPTERPVLVSGETGTGKELVAQALHDLSPRAGSPFVAVNCAAIASALFESELFGSLPGAYTGATRRRGGLVAEAQRGTLFLDEIGELSLKAQAKLLRVLENGAYRPVGGSREARADFRLIAATNRDLFHQVEENAFRRDLYYRLCVLDVDLPPLRDRREDIPMLVRHFLSAEGVDPHERFPTPYAVSQLVSHDWPGNVRELGHVIARSLLWAREGRIESFELRREPVGKTAGTSRHGIDREALGHLLFRHQGRLGPCASELGVSERTLQRRMKDLSLRLKDFRSNRF